MVCRGTHRRGSVGPEWRPTVGAGAAGMWQQEGEGPWQLAGGEACTAAPASTAPSARRCRRGLGPGCGHRTHGPVPELLPLPCSSPCLPSALAPHCCALTACPGSTGAAAPAVAFYSCPHCDTAPVLSQNPERITGQPCLPSPARSGNSSWPWAPKAPTHTKCRPITREPGNSRAWFDKAGTSALTHNSCQI